MAYLCRALNFNDLRADLASQFLPVRIWLVQLARPALIKEAPSVLALHTLWHAPFPLTRAFFSPPSVKIHINYSQICVKVYRGKKQMYILHSEMICLRLN